MLFDFYNNENSKKPGSIHAIYLLSGIRTITPSQGSSNNEPADGEDVPMQSSPFMASSAVQQDGEEEEPSACKSIILCREEDLEGQDNVCSGLPTCPLNISSDSLS